VHHRRHLAGLLPLAPTLATVRLLQQFAGQFDRFGGKLRVVGAELAASVEAIANMRHTRHFNPGVLTEDAIGLATGGQIQAAVAGGS
jgi:hypothetical protein